MLEATDDGSSVVVTDDGSLVVVSDSGLLVAVIDSSADVVVVNDKLFASPVAVSEIASANELVTAS